MTTLASSLEDVRAIVAHQLDLLETQPDAADTVAPLMLWGPPGVGKSAVVRAVCEARGIGFVDVRLAQREPIDLRGLPVPRGDAVEWLLSSEWPRDAQSKGILLFDELTAADRTLQVAAYELILDRRLGTLYTLPPGWLVLGAGNRTSDRAVAGAMSSALANRFCHLELEPSLDEWRDWAQRVGLDPLVPGFLQFRPELFLDLSGDVQRGWPSPRSWERAARAIMTAGGLGERRLRRVLEGLVGQGAAAELLAFRDLLDTLPDVPEALAGASRIRVPERADRRFALCTAVVQHFWSVRQRATALERVLDLVEDLAPDFATLLLADLVRGRPAEDTRALFVHPRFVAQRERLGPIAAGRLMHATDRRLAEILGGLSDV